MIEPTRSIFRGVPIVPDKHGLALVLHPFTIGIYNPHVVADGLESGKPFSDVPLEYNLLLRAFQFSSRSTLTASELLERINWVCEKTFTKVGVQRPKSHLHYASIDLSHQDLFMLENQRRFLRNSTPKITAQYAVAWEQGISTLDEWLCDGECG